MLGERRASLSVIIPTLNEEAHLKFLLESLKDQRSVEFEAIVIDGGSKDATATLAQRYKAVVLVLPNHGEFVSRNIGAKIAKGEYLLFTCADIIFPEDLFCRILEKFSKNPKLIALTGPGYPFDAPAIGKVEYAMYNLVRRVFASLPSRTRRFSTSTNFLVVKRNFFEKAGGFDVDDINADGLMGRRLLALGEVGFFVDTAFYLSARRLNNMGLMNFNRHYLYALENFLFSASNSDIVKGSKNRSKAKHRAMHEV